MGQAIKYSIILPVRNGGELVKECIHSILIQEHHDFELLVLDNCSDDGTLEWLKSLQHPGIRLYPSSRPLSIGENWARIAHLDKKEFMTIIGHDDKLLPHYLGEMDQLINKHPEATLYQTHFDYIDVNGRCLRPCLPMDEIQQGYEFLACQMSRTMDSMGTGYMMRSADYDQLGGITIAYPNLIFADYELWVQLSLKGYKATSGSTCFHYRIHENTSKHTNGEQYAQAFEKYIYFMASMAKRNVRVNEVIQRYGHGMLMYFCESLSHRLLKTPQSSRVTSVADFIEKCRHYAEVLVPGQTFDPGSRFRISIAEKLDKNFIGRSAFSLFKKITK